MKAKKTITCRITNPSKGKLESLEQEYKKAQEYIRDKDVELYLATKQAMDCIESYMEDVVNGGSFISDTKITTTHKLKKEVLDGAVVEQEVTGVFGIGLMLGSALERDIPSDSDTESAWKNGELSLNE